MSGRKKDNIISGTKAGAAKAAATNRERHGDDFYVRIGRMGGHNGKTGGFASEKIGKDGLSGRDRAVLAGSIGGRKSKRGPKKAL